MLFFILLTESPWDGYYMFTVFVRQNGEVHCAGSIMKTPAADLNNAVMLCRSERGAHDWQTGSCSVRKETKEHNRISNFQLDFFHQTN